LQCHDGMFHAQNEMVHMTQCTYHDADSMMHTPLCKDDNALTVCMYDMHMHDAHDSHPVTALSWLTPC